jgi:hypothetical protein
MAETGLGFGPQFVTEAWRFLTNPKGHVAALSTSQDANGYAPWSAFVSGVGISVSLLALQATRAAYFFDSVVMFLVLVGSACLFIFSFYFVALLLGGRARLVQVVGAGEYLAGFLLPTCTAVAFVSVLAVNSFPGTSCTVGYFSFVCDVVPTSTNMALKAAAITAILLAGAFSTIRCFVLLKAVEQFPVWKAIAAIAPAAVLTFLLRGSMEFYVRIFSGVAHDAWKALAGG